MDLKRDAGVYKRYLCEANIQVLRTDFELEKVGKVTK